MRNKVWSNNIVETQEHNMYRIARYIDWKVGYRLEGGLMSKREAAAIVAKLRAQGQDVEVAHSTKFQEK